MEKKVEIPSNIDIKIREGTVKVKKDGDKLEETFKLGRINLGKKDGEIKISIDNPVSKEKAMVGTIKGKINNMIKGLEEGYEYKLRVIYQHFPIRLNLEGNKLKIENFTGESKPRYAEIVGDTDVEVKGEEIVVKGKDKEKTGQTAANIEQVTWLKNKDPRVFEDGIYITKKPGD